MSLKRMFTRRAVSRAITLVAGLRYSTVQIASVDGSKMAVPSSRGMRASCSSAASSRASDVGAVGIGRVALFADHAQHARSGGTPAPNFNHLAHRVGARRLPTRQTSIRSPAVFHVIQQCAGAVDALLGFLVSVIASTIGSFGRVSRQSRCRAVKGGHTDFISVGAAPVHIAVFDLRGQGRIVQSARSDGTTSV